MSEPNDAEWLRARERGDDVSHVPKAARAPYDQLERLLRALPSPASSPAWQRQVLDAVDRPAVAAPPRVRPSHKLRWMLAGATVAAAAAVITAIALIRPGSEPAVPSSISSGSGHVGSPSIAAAEPIVTTEIRRSAAPHRGGRIALGDSLIVRARSWSDIELRLYGDAGEPLARCPGVQGCRVVASDGHRDYLIELVLRAPGDIHTVVFMGDGMPAAFQSLDADVAAAQRSNVEARESSVINVQ
jgi:hypothetical protein